MEENQSVMSFSNLFEPFSDAADREAGIAGADDSSTDGPAPPPATPGDGPPPPPDDLGDGPAPPPDDPSAGPATLGKPSRHTVTRCPSGSQHRVTEVLF